LKRLSIPNNIVLNLSLGKESSLDVLTNVGEAIYDVPKSVDEESQDEIKSEESAHCI
jgi:hypothetical protein